MKVVSRSLLLLWLGFWILQAELYSQAWIPAAKQGRRENQFSVDYGGVRFDRDYYFHLSPNWSYNFHEDFGFSLSVPLNLLVVDSEPTLEDRKPGSLRIFDYNETSDYFRVIQYISYGQYEREIPGKTSFSFYTGDIRDGRIGHGTILNQYYNNIRYDVYNAGILSDWNSDYLGFQFFSNSLYSRDVNAIRAYIKPLAIGRGLYILYQIHKNQFQSDEEEVVGMMQYRGNVADDAGRKKVIEEVDGIQKQRPAKPSPVAKYSKMEIEEQDEWYNRLTIGFTRAFDRKAPLSLNYSQVGIPERQERRDQPSVREDGRISVEGIDAEYRLLNLQYYELTPYLDVNRIRELENSGGTHYGFMARIGDKNIHLILKPEFRRMSKNYIPMYFDTFYEVERFHGNLSSRNPMDPKFTRAQGLDTAGGISGYFHSLLLNYYGYSLELSYEDYEGENNSRIFLGTYIPLGSAFTLSFFYTKKGFNRRGEAFRVDNASMGAVELSLPMGPVQVRLQNLRRWKFAEGERGFRAFDEARLLISASYVF